MSAPASFCNSCRQKVDVADRSLMFEREGYNRNMAKYGETIANRNAALCIERLERERAAIVCCHQTGPVRVRDQDALVLTFAGLPPGHLEKLLQTLASMRAAIDRLKVLLPSECSDKMSVADSSFSFFERVTHDAAEASRRLTASAAGGGTLEVRLEPFVPPAPASPDEEVKK